MNRTYPELTPTGTILHAVRGESPIAKTGCEPQAGGFRNGYAPRSQSCRLPADEFSAICHALRGKSISIPVASNSMRGKSEAVPRKSLAMNEFSSLLQIPHALRAESWRLELHREVRALGKEGAL